MARLLLGLSVIACATPAERADRAAKELGLQRDVLRGSRFDHVVYGRVPSLQTETLHIYLEGDGAPARAWRTIPPDPTPQDPLMLELLALDPAPSLLLGRPCYHGVDACSPEAWTTGRFGEDVVASLAEAVRTICATRAVKRVVLIGHSGGGTLAMLLAERVPEAIAVVTVGGNIDVSAWTAQHASAPLSSSLDPALRPPLPAHILQLHLLGGRDQSVPPSVGADAIARQPVAQTWLFPSYDHHCCWTDAWPAVLDRLDAELAR